jgi:hypothetical protein
MFHLRIHGPGERRTARAANSPSTSFFRQASDAEIRLREPVQPPDAPFVRRPFPFAAFAAIAAERRDGLLRRANLRGMK